MRIVPIDWKQFQHYTDRSPPWIKLHKGLLTNPKWHRLNVASRALAPLLWLLASDARDGVIDDPLEDIAFRVHCSPEVLDEAIKDLIARGFFLLLPDVASTAHAKRQQHAAPEREGERETEKEGEGKKKAKAKVEAPPLPGWLDSAAWTTFLAYRTEMRKPLTPLAIKGCFAKLERLRSEGHDPIAVLRQSQENSWTGVFPVKENDKGGKRGRRDDERANTLAGLTGAGGQRAGRTIDAASGRVD